MGVINYRNRNVCSSYTLGQAYRMFCNGGDRQPRTGDSSCFWGFCQLFKDFQLCFRRMIKVFSETKAGAMFGTGFGSLINGSNVIVVLPTRSPLWHPSCGKSLCSSVPVDACFRISSYQSLQAKFSYS